jgi:protein CpxP
MTDPTTRSDPLHPLHPRPRRWRGLLFTAVIVLAAGLTGAFVTQAVGHGFGSGPGGWRHGGLMGGPIDPARIEAHADRMVRHVAIEIDATPEQQTRLRAIVGAAVKDLLPLREQAHAAHEQVHGLLTASTLDRAALEKFRSEHMGQLDAASKRVAQAVGDVAEVLTPAQRQKLDELVKHHRAHGHGGHR